MGIERHRLSALIKDEPFLLTPLSHTLALLHNLSLSL
jgi:hypothetical protein